MGDLIEVLSAQGKKAEATAVLREQWALARAIASSASRSIVLVIPGWRMTSAPIQVRVRVVSGNHIS